VGASQAFHGEFFLSLSTLVSIAILIFFVSDPRKYWRATSSGIQDNSLGMAGVSSPHGKFFPHSLTSPITILIF
jgi:hypothetical protein